MVYIDDKYYYTSCIFKSTDSLGIMRFCYVETTVRMENINGKAHVKNKWWKVYNDFETIEEFGTKVTKGIGDPTYYDTASKASRRISCILKNKENYTLRLREYIDSVTDCYQHYVIDKVLWEEKINNFTKDMRELLDKYNAHIHVEHSYGYDGDSWDEVSVKFENGEEGIVDIAEKISNTVVIK